MVLDRYISRPLQIVLGIWLVFFIVMRIIYIHEGYSESSQKFAARWEGHRDCMNKPGHRIAFPKDCQDLDSLSYYSPYWDGINNAWRKTYFCGVVECSTLFDHGMQSLSSLGVYFAAASVLTVLCGAFLYVILSRTLQLGYVQPHPEKRARELEHVDYGQIPQHAWRQFNQFLQHHSLAAALPMATATPAVPAKMAAAAAANNRNQRLTYTYYQGNEGEEEDH